MENKIIPCLWFDGEAEDAAKFYTSVFSDSKILKKVPYNVDTPSQKPVGSLMTISFEIEGQEFLGLNGGSYFTKNPSVSFIVGCSSEEEVDRLWEKLSPEGKILMPLEKYPFSDRYGWVEDRFGVSWQIILTKSEGDERPKIVPSLMFIHDNYGKAKEAIDFYLKTFRNSKMGNLFTFEKDEPVARKGDVIYSDLMIENQWVAIMENNYKHEFNFNEGISFIIMCDNDEEMDFYWDRLSARKEAEQCGWLKDKYGVSWQVATRELDELLEKKEVMEEMLNMKKIDMKRLKEVYDKS